MYGENLTVGHLGMQIHATENMEKFVGLHKLFENKETQYV